MGRSITVSGYLARNYPEIVVKYMEGFVRAGIWAQDNREEVIDIFSKELYVTRRSIVRSFPDNFHELLIPSLDSKKIRALEIEKDFLLTYGYIVENFDVNKWIDASFLEKALENVC